MSKKYLIILSMFLVVVLSSFVQSACLSLNRSTENNISRGEWTICNNAVYNFTLSSNSKNAIYMNNSHTSLDCNGSRIHGNASGRGITFGYSGTVNITIKNCLIDTFNLGIKGESGATAGLWNALIDNVTVYNISGCGNAGFYNGGFGNVTVQKSNFSDNKNYSACGTPPPHGIYISSAVAGNDNRSSKNVKIIDTITNNNANSGIQINSQMFVQNVIVKNIVSCGNKASGYHFWTVTNGSFVNLTSCNNGNRGASVWGGDYALATNNSVFSEFVFLNNTNGAWIIFNNTNNQYKNNTYDDIVEASFQIRDENGVLNMSILESTPITVNYASDHYSAPNSYVNLTFPQGYSRNVMIYNNNVTLLNQALNYPYNDLNLNGVLNRSNMDNYSLILGSGYSGVVGNFSYLSYACSHNVSGSILNVPCLVVDPDSVFTYLGVTVYNGLSVVAYKNTTNLSSVLSFTLAQGSYTYKVFVHNSKGTIESSPVSFNVNANISTGTDCDDTSHNLWALFILIYIVGFVYFAYDGFMNGNGTSILLLIVTVCIGALLIGTSVNMLRSLC